MERYNETESFDINDNRTEEVKELIALRKRLKDLEMENDNYFKESGTDTRAKIDLIIANKEKYSISAMCRLLKIRRSLVYYHIQHRKNKQRKGFQKKK